MATHQYLRAKVKWPVLIKTNKRTIEGVTLNLSADGAFIRCAKPLRLNEVVDMIIKVPNLDRSLKANVEVVWSNIYGPDDETTPRGMGVRFLKISSEDRQVIAKEVLQHLQADKKKIDPKELQTLQTLIIDQDEVGPAAS